MRVKIAIMSICLTVAISVPAGAQNPRPAARNAYDGLDNNKLVQNLTNMKMGELIRELSKDLSGDAKIQTEIAGLLVEADATMDQKKRDELYDKVVEKQQEIVDKMTTALPKDPTGEDLVKVYNARITLIDIQGLRRTKSYTDLLLYLLGGEEDRKEVEEHTGIAVGMLDKLNKDIQTKLLQWGQDQDRLIADRPALEEILPMLDYKSAWIKYYRGSAIPADDRNRDAERKKVLNESIDLATKFANNKDFGVVPWGLRLRAAGYRETGQYKVAESDFNTVLNDPQAPTVAKLECLFELARNLAEYGASYIKEDQLDKGNEKFNAALDAAKKFPEAAESIMGKGARLGIDLKAAMLNSYIYELWSKAVKPKDPKKAEEYMIKAQDAFLTLMTKYPQYNDEFIKMFAEKYRTGSGGAKPETMPPAILYGLARQELNKRTKEGMDKALEYLSALIDRAAKGDQGAKTLEPLALLDNGITKAYQKKYREAADILRSVVERFPDFEKAPLAAYNAVNVYNNLINNHAKDKPGEDIPINYREGLIKCIQVMLSRYEKDPEPFKAILEGMSEKDLDLKVWYYDLGYNSEVMADYSDTARRAKSPASAPAASQPTSGPAMATKTREQWFADAIAAYEKYPQDKPEYIQCRDRIVHITWKPYEDFGEEDLKTNKDAILKVLPKLKEFVDFAQKKIAQLKPIVQTPENKSDLAKKLNELYKMYDLAQGQDAARLKNIIDFKQLQDSGSWADFTALSLRYDLSGDKSVLPEIDKFPEKWPGMQILRNSMEFVIRKLVDEGKIKEAISKVQEFQNKYSAKEATDLIGLVLSKVRKKINELQALAKKDAAKKQELGAYVQAYSEFAKTLYEEGRRRNADQDKLYPLQQMYGESLLMLAESASQEEQQKDYKEAGDLFKECYEYDLKEHQQKFKKDKLDEIERRLKAVRDAGANYTVLDSLAKDYFKFCSDNQIEIITGQEVQLRLTADAMLAAANEKDREPLTAKVSELLTAVYSALTAKNERGLTRIDALVPVDATNVRGIAKCAFHLKDYKLAKEFYEKLLSGLDPWKYPDMYWEAKTDFFEAQLDLIRTESKTPDKDYDALAMAIHKLLVDSENDPRLIMYIRPFKERLLEIEAKAREMSKTKFADPAPPASNPSTDTEVPGPAESQPATAESPETAPASKPA